MLPLLNSESFKFYYREKANKYGDRVLKTIEATIKRYNEIKQNGNNANGRNYESSDSSKRRLGSPYTDLDNHDFINNTAQSNKRLARMGNNCRSEMPMDDIQTYEEILVDAELDGMDIEEEIVTNGKSKSFHNGATDFSYGSKSCRNHANPFRKFEFRKAKK